MQLAAMRDYAKRRGWIVATESKEVGSGAKSHPLREELLKAARRRGLPLGGNRDAQAPQTRDDD